MIGVDILKIKNIIITSIGIACVACAGFGVAYFFRQHKIKEFK